MALEMTKVKNCSASECAYNAGKICHALAITIGDPPREPNCDTYFQSEVQGGGRYSTAGVGACKTFDCSFNRDFKCTASHIQVGINGNQPDCLTFQPR